MTENATSAVKKQGSMKYVVILALSAGMAGLLYGYDTVSISGAIEFLRQAYNLSAGLQGLVISSIMIGGVVGVGFSGFLADKIGRRKVLLIGAACFFFAALWSAFTYTPWTLIAARIVGGVGIGLGLRTGHHLHHRMRSGQVPWHPELRIPAAHHPRHLPDQRHQLRHRQRGQPRLGHQLRLALDARHRLHPGGHLLPRAVPLPGIPALPHPVRS